MPIASECVVARRAHPGGSLKAEGLGDGSTVFVRDYWWTNACRCHSPILGGPP